MLYSAAYILFFFSLFLTLGEAPDNVVFCCVYLVAFLNIDFLP